MTSKPETVYVIDDEQDVRDALRMLLKSIGLVVETFASAVDFLGQYQVEWPGCIVVDIRMPGMSGIELQEKLNAMGAPIPVIIISGHADVPTAVRVIQEGAVDLLENPSPSSDCWTRCRRPSTGIVGCGSTILNGNRFKAVTTP